jgi:prepilin-type N-terminal cleavage/methylation domain-containing protein
MAHCTRDRSGFTLVEILIVIAIILTLMAITAGAVSSLRRSAAYQSTESVINRLATTLDQQVKSVVDTVRQTPAVGTGKQKLINRTILVRDTLFREFPQNFAEVRKDITPVDPNHPFLPPRKSAYTALIGVTALPNGSPDPDQITQSAICLYMFLNQARRGMTSDAETTSQKYTALYAGLPYYIDTWGNPIVFVREPSGSLELRDEPLYGGNTDATKRINPFDPENLLPAANQPTPNTNINVLPTIISSGPDGFLGVDGSLTIINAEQESDNLYSYRIRRAGARGGN